MPRTKDPLLHADLAKKQTYAAYVLVKLEREEVSKKKRELEHKLTDLTRREEQLRKSLNALNVSVVDGSDIKFRSDDDGA